MLLLAQHVRELVLLEVVRQVVHRLLELVPDGVEVAEDVPELAETGSGVAHKPQQTDPDRRAQE